jgi:hypothetical protein
MGGLLWYWAKTGAETETDAARTAVGTPIRENFVMPCPPSRAILEPALPGVSEKMLKGNYQGQYSKNEPPQQRIRAKAASLSSGLPLLNPEVLSPTLPVPKQGWGLHTGHGEGLKE